MFKYLVAFSLITPLVGIFLIEKGEYAASVGKDGFENGALGVYLIYVLIVTFFSYLYLKLGNIKLKKIKNLYDKSVNGSSKLDYQIYGIILLSFNFFILMILLFVFGGYQVLIGNVGKGEFRANLGFFGAIAYILTKFTIPVLFAYLCIRFKNIRKNLKDNFLWALNLLLVILIGASWGFKTTGILIALPGIILYFKEISIYVLVKIGFVFLIVTYFLFSLFDAEQIIDQHPLVFLFQRLTIYQGDVSWYLWGKYLDGDLDYDYFPTLLAALGDTNLRLFFGLSKDNLQEWMKYHFDWMLNDAAGIPLESVLEGHNVTGTVFSEGLIAGGVLGIIIFALLASAVVGLNYYLIFKKLYQHKFVLSSIYATYFVWNVFAWLNGGSVTQLFHISLFFGLLFTLFVIYFLLGLVKLISKIMQSLQYG